jgi:hypothetical protein
MVSRLARDQSTRPWAPSRSMSWSCSRSNTPALLHSTRRRRTVASEPQPSSPTGNSRQGVEVRAMYTIAAKQWRSRTVRVRPPYQGRGAGGSSGARIAQQLLRHKDLNQGRHHEPESCHASQEERHAVLGPPPVRWSAREPAPCMACSWCVSCLLDAPAGPEASSMACPTSWIGTTVGLTNVELWLQFLKAPDGPRRGCSSRSGCRVDRRPVPAGRRPGSRLPPHCCQQRQGSRMDEGLGTAVSGWTRVSSSARNRFG